MSETRTAGRAISDIVSVCRHARPVSTARWLTSFAAPLTECYTTRSLWAALAGARVVAVEAQDFGPEIRRLAAHNGVGERVHVEIALTGGIVTDGASAGVVADDRRWAATSHGAAQRPTSMSVPQIMVAYDIRRIGLVKVDIEGGEFAVFGRDEDLRWLDRVEQAAMEVHRNFGDAVAMVGWFCQHGFAIDLRDNAGTPVPVTSERLDYAYFRRS